MRLQELNLKLLLVLHHLLREKRVSTVATVLGMSQPAVSSALGQLRRTLGDELFVRTQHGMQATPYVQALGEPLAQALEQLQAALTVRGGFDPATSERRFVLAMTDVGEMYFLPVLMAHLAQHAPGVTLQVRPVTEAQLPSDMAQGQVDLALGHLPQLQAGFFQQLLFHQHYCLLMRQGHPLAAARRPTVRAVAQAMHVRVEATGTGHGRVDQALAQRGLKRRICLTVPHYVALAQVLAATDLVATVPERFAQRVAETGGLVSRALPVAVDNSAIHQFWHTRVQRDPGHRWLRGVVHQLFGSAQASAESPADAALGAE